MDETEKALELQNILQKFIDSVDEKKNAEDPGGNDLTAEFRELREIGMKMREQNKHPCEEGKKSYNIRKNRFKDILPFDATRVTLDEIPGEEGSDYINANFILDVWKKQAYIASQGPVKATINDFWRMIWQYNVKVVAMACRLVEMGKRKCEQYWPTEDEEIMECGDITVTLVEEKDLAEHCTIRTLRAEKDGVSRTVRQFHYTGWPDHDIPTDFDDVLEMIALMRKIKADDPQRAPMVVHCSAGCGRTGTICAIDYSWEMLKMGQVNADFSLYDIIKQLRNQRQSMIQTPDQYEFAHIAVQRLFQKHLEMMEDHIYGNVNIGVKEDEDNMYSSAITQRKESVLEDDINQTISELYGTVYTKTQLPEPLIPTKYEPPAEQEKVVSPGLQDKIAVFSVEKIENIPNQKTSEQRSSFKQQNSSERPKIEARKPSLKGMAPQPDVRQVSTPSRENSQRHSELVKTESASIEPKRSSVKADSHTVTVNKQGIDPQAQAIRRSGCVKAPDHSNLIRTESTEIEGKHKTILTVGPPIKAPASTTKSFPLPKETGPVQPDVKARTLPMTSNANLTDGAKNNQSLTFNAGAGFYSYAQVMPGNQPGLAGNSQIYSAAKEPNPIRSGSQNAYSAVNKDGNNTESNLYSEVDKAKLSHAKYNGQATSDTAYESVQFNENQAPAVPYRGYLDPEPNQQETDKGTEESSVKKKMQIISGFKTLFGGKGSTGGGNADSSDIPGYKVKLGKKPNGPRNPPSSWNKK